MKFGIKKQALLSAIALLVLAGGLYATPTTTFTLTGVTTTGQMGGVYTSPYFATIQTGSNTQTGVDVICDDFTDEVWINESWTVVATSLASLPALGANSPVLWDTGATAQQQIQDYMTAAILSAELLAINNPSTQQAEDLSFAIWDVFDPGASSGLSAGDQANITGAGGYLPTAEALAASDLAAAHGNIAAALALDNIANVEIYTANPKSGGAVTYCPNGPGGCSAPQEFLVINMAEPPSPALLAVDLLAVLGLVLFVRRRMVRV